MREPCGSCRLSNCGSGRDVHLGGTRSSRLQLQNDAHSARTGSSPCKYIVRLRLNRAKRLLEIALESGFASHAHFAHAFRHALGLRSEPLSNPAEKMGKRAITSKQDPGH